MIRFSQPRKPISKTKTIRNCPSSLYAIRQAKAWTGETMAWLIQSGTRDLVEVAGLSPPLQRSKLLGHCTLVTFTRCLNNSLLTAPSKTTGARVAGLKEPCSTTRAAQPSSWVSTHTRQEMATVYKPTSLLLRWKPLAITMSSRTVQTTWKMPFITACSLYLLKRTTINSSTTVRASWIALLAAQEWTTLRMLSAGVLPSPVSSTGSWEIPGELAGVSRATCVSRLWMVPATVEFSKVWWCPLSFELICRAILSNLCNNNQSNSIIYE